MTEQEIVSFKNFLYDALYHLRTEDINEEDYQIRIYTLGKIEGINHALQVFKAITVKMSDN